MTQTLLPHAAERGNDLLTPVEDDIQGVRDSGRRGDRPHVIVDGISFRDPPGCGRVGNPGSVSADGAATEDVNK